MFGWWEFRSTATTKPSKAEDIKSFIQHTCSALHPSQIKDLEVALISCMPKLEEAVNAPPGLKNIFRDAGLTPLRVGKFEALRAQASLPLPACRLLAGKRLQHQASAKGGASSSSPHLAEGGQGPELRDLILFAT